MSSPSLFLSRVTGDFAELCRRLVQILPKADCHVKTEDDFAKPGVPILAKLDDYLHRCTAVVHLVGPAVGSIPTRPLVDDLIDRHPEGLFNAAALAPLRDAVLAPAARDTFSYTQWEAYLARHHDIPLLVYCTAEPYDSWDPRQREHLARLEEIGIHYTVVPDERDVREQILRDLVAILAKQHPAQAAELKALLKPNNLPYRTLGKLFKGRDEFLRAIEAALGGHRAAAVVNAIHGLGGVGKTRAAVEYALANADRYSALLFVVADSRENLERNLAELVDPLVLDLPEQAAREQDVRLAAVVKWLNAHPGWLLILDNVDTKEAAAAAEEWVTRLAGGHVVLTSRLSEWSADVEALELSVLTEEAATEFLLSRTENKRRPGPDDADTARAIARDLGQLALALEQAGAFIAHRRCTLTQYRDIWRTSDTAINWFDERIIKYPRSVAQTWSTSFDQLNADARRLLELLAWLAPDPIPESLLDVPVPDAPLNDPHEALAELAAYSLTTRDANEPRFVVHRLVQDVTRRRLKAAGDRQRLTEALVWMSIGFAGDAQDVRSWATLIPLAPHAGRVSDFADEMNIADLTAILKGKLGQLHFYRSLYREAEPLTRRALAIDEASFGADHPVVAIRLNNLATLLYETNRLGEAEPLMRRALAINEASFGADHPNVAIVLNNLASLLQDTNRLTEAERLMCRALAIDEASFGADHPTVARDLNNLAWLLQETNRLGEAEPLRRRALAIVETSFGADHPNVATNLNNLALLLRATNRLGEAEPLMRRALAIAEASFGADHPNVAIALTNLAGLLKTTNRLGETEPLMHRALGILEKFRDMTGHEHPNYQTVLLNYRRMSEPAE